MPPRDPVVLALASIASGSAGGAAVVTAGLVALRTLQQQRGVSPDDDAGFLVLSGGLVAGVLLAAVLGWRLTRAIDDHVRRGVTSAVAVGVACLLALAGAPVDLVAGRAGLVGYALVLLVAGWWAAGRARRAV